MGVLGRGGLRVDDPLAAGEERSPAAPATSSSEIAGRLATSRSVRRGEHARGGDHEGDRIEATAKPYRGFQIPLDHPAADRLTRALGADMGALCDGGRIDDRQRTFHVEHRQP